MESFSQFGEDVLVWEFFQHRSNGFFIEVGANAPVVFSQTWLLEKNGWSGILVEPLASKCERLRAERPRSRVFQAAASSPDERGEMTLAVPEDDMFASLRPGPKAPAAGGGVRRETVRVVTLDDILAEAGNPAIDFISIDVEGLELEVLRGLDLARHRPQLILMEDHLKHLKVCRHLWAADYQLVKRTGCNNWFVPRGTPFAFSTAGERFRLWKRIWLHTPLAVVREKLRAWRRG